jgi:hypothetical protein
MLDFDDNIDLDVLFDSLSLGKGEPKSSDVIRGNISSNPEVSTADIQELSCTGVDLFVFDNPADQS